MSAVDHDTVSGEAFVALVARVSCLEERVDGIMRVLQRLETETREYRLATDDRVSLLEDKARRAAPRREP